MVDKWHGPPQDSIISPKRETFSIKLVSPNSIQSQVNKVIDNLKGSPPKKKKKSFKFGPLGRQTPYNSLINSN